MTLHGIKRGDFFINDTDLVDRVMGELIKIKQKSNSIVNTADHLEKIKDYFKNPNFTQVKRSRCMLGQTNLNINEYGDMSFCYKFDNRFGNVNDGPIQKTWKNAKSQKVTQDDQKLQATLYVPLLSFHLHFRKK